MPVVIGESGAKTYRLERGQEALFLTTAPQTEGAACSLEQEAQKLRWMQAQGLPVPEVLEFLTHAGQQYLLTAALEGTDAAQTPLEPARVVETLADALGLLHATPITQCPFDQTLDRRLEQARIRLERGQVDGLAFDRERLGQGSPMLYRDLLERRPLIEPRVFCHGDYCLPNIIVRGDGALSGFVDVGRAGIADRHQDLALVLRSLEGGQNPAYVGLGRLFLERYGLPDPDPELLIYYRLLDEFF